MGVQWTLWADNRNREYALLPPDFGTVHRGGVVVRLFISSW